MIITITISTLKNYKFTRLKLFQKKRKIRILITIKLFFIKTKYCRNLQKLEKYYFHKKNVFLLKLPNT